MYPTIPEGIRVINLTRWGKIENAYNNKDNHELLKELIKLGLFPIKDSYVAYLRKDRTAIDRNPKTVDRICGRLYEMGLDTIFARCSEPKETNRQIGPFFRRWLNKPALGIQPVNLKEFMSSNNNAILNGSDAQLASFAKEHLNYNVEKGLDFLGRFNGKYVIGEAKFLTDFGGHQAAQFNDAITVVKAEGVKAIMVAILDGVVYLGGKHKMRKGISSSEEHIILSSLVLQDFLYQI